jgi:hypothetical protein
VDVDQRPESGGTKMSDATHPLDPTRRQLRIFGVSVTNYEERTAALLQKAAAAGMPEERLQAARDVAAMTADLNGVLREMASYVLEVQSRVLTDLAAILQEPSPT